jgi:ribonuclease HII
MKIIGIDDAGRGPVIGPMVLTGVLLNDVSEEATLKLLGAKDSKLLTKKQRKLLSEKIKKDYVFHSEIAEPKEIDDFPNLNNLEAVKCGIIINSLMQDIDEKVKVVVDCPSVNTEAWGELLFSTIVKKEYVDLSCEHKADLKHPVVSAASIVAKERREDILKELKTALGINFGSGYPSDPKTKDFLVKTFGDSKYDLIIRKSWKTYKNVADKFGQKKLYYL